MDVLVRLRVLLMEHMNFSTIGVDFHWISTLILTIEVAMNSALKVDCLCCLHVVVPSVQGSSSLLLLLRQPNAVGMLHVRNPPVA